MSDGQERVAVFSDSLQGNLKGSKNIRYVWRYWGRL